MSEHLHEHVNGVTIVVPTLNRDDVLMNCLNDLLAQSFHPLEVLIVDQSEKASSKILEKQQENPNTINYHHVTFRGLPHARNYGWQHARYNMVVFVDDDIRCGVEFVEEHVAALQMPGVGLVAGGIDEPHASTERPQITGRFRTWTATPLSGFGAHGTFEVELAKGCNFSAWRHVLQKVGGVDEAFNVGAALYEESDLCLRVREAGFKIMFNGRARVTHLAESSGGCRVKDVVAYVWALAHNRTLMILRHVPVYQRPFAFIRLLFLGGAYAFRYQTPTAFVACLKGCLKGFNERKNMPHCSQYIA